MTTCDDYNLKSYHVQRKFVENRLLWAQTTVPRSQQSRGTPVQIKEKKK